MMAGPSRRLNKCERGASLIEVMIATGIFAVAFSLITPFMLQGRRLSKYSEFSDVCVNAVRTKLNEYKFGTETQLGDISTRLTTESGIWGNRGTGFVYAKRRYNLERDAYCPRDTSSANSWAPKSVRTKPTLPANLADLGREECVSGFGGGPPLTCSSALDASIRSSVKPFRLFVNLRRYNPLQGLEDCPWYSSTSSYDYLQAEDMIKITVTALADLSTSGKYGDVSSASPRHQELQCQISDYLRPQATIARYWMQSDGRIFRWQGTGESSGTYEVFKSLASPSNIGFTVSPDNQHVILLRPGTLIRYSNCTGDPIDCDPSTQTVWQVDNGLSAITGKWMLAYGATQHAPNPTCGNPATARGLPVLFGLMGDRRTPVCIDLANELGGATPVTIRYDGYDPGGGVGPTRIPFQVSNTGRLHTIFMDARGLATYAVDLTCDNVIGRTHCTAIYDANDTQMLYPLHVFSVRAIAFSR